MVWSVPAVPFAAPALELAAVCNYWRIFPVALGSTVPPLPDEPPTAVTARSNRFQRSVPPRAVELRRRSSSARAGSGDQWFASRLMLLPTCTEMFPASG